MSDEPPAIRIVRGVPTSEELAALVGVLGRRVTGGAPAMAAPVSRWTTSARPAARMARPGPGVWRAAALPRI